MSELVRQPVVHAAGVTGAVVASITDENLGRHDEVSARLAMGDIHHNRPRTGRRPAINRIGDRPPGINT
jgi:hypothetical protein